MEGDDRVELVQRRAQELENLVRRLQMGSEANSLASAIQQSKVRLAQELVDNLMAKIRCYKIGPQMLQTCSSPLTVQH